MRSLPFISLLFILLLSGCSSMKPAGLKSPGDIETSCCNSLEIPDLSLFKATLEIKKHRLTGLLIIKRVDSLSESGSQSGKTYRIVFSNEIGLTFFDIEISTNSGKVHSCFSSLNKKSLLNILFTDFQTLTSVNGFIPEEHFVQNITGNQVLFGRSGKLKTWKVFSPTGDSAISLSAGSNFANKVTLDFSKWTDNVPGMVVLKNQFIGMTLTLKRLK